MGLKFWVSHCWPLDGRTASCVDSVCDLHYLNILYSLKLKHIPIIDCFIIAIGFIIRLVIGASVSHVDLSMWIIIMTFLLSLFLAFSKRKGDLTNVDVDSTARPVLVEYNQEFFEYLHGHYGFCRDCCLYHVHNVPYSDSHHKFQSCLHYEYICGLWNIEISKNHLFWSNNRQPNQGIN